MLISCLCGHRTAVVAITVASAILVLAIGALLWPDMFWDGFIYRYFWGPIVSDREGSTVDVAEGYNVVNTLVYALVLGLGLVIMSRIMEIAGIEIDWKFIAASLPLFILGGVARALEDAALFGGDLVYWFISPLIYVTIIFVFLAAIMLGLLARRDARISLLALPVIAIVVVMVQGLAGDDLAYRLPWWAIVVCAIPAVFMTFKEKDGVRSSLLITGGYLATLSIAFTTAFVFDAAWRERYAEISGSAPDPHYWELVIIPVLAMVVTVMVYAVGRWRPWTQWTLPANIAMFAGHLLDGTATYRGIEIYGYREKHVLPSWLIEITGTAAIMIPMKLLLVAGIVYLLDVFEETDLELRAGLMNPIKFAIVFLGLAPGVRDLVRISLGV